MDNENEEVLENNESIQEIDYYDNYYDRVLNNMNTIIINQETIMSNQENIIKQNNTNNLFSGSILFVFCIFLIYYFVRNMIIVK